jgi:hypothetical protein
MQLSMGRLSATFCCNLFLMNQQLQTVDLVVTAELGLMLTVRLAMRRRALRRFCQICPVEAKNSA